MITPEQLAASGTEHGHQVAFFQWAATISNVPDMDMLFAVPNGGERNLKVAANMKAEGVKSGVPDVVWPVPCGRWAGLYLELKKPGVEGHANGGRSEAQVRWHRKLIVKHYCVITVYGWRAMAKAVEIYWQQSNGWLTQSWDNRGGRVEGDCLFVAEINSKGRRVAAVATFDNERFQAW